MLSICRMQHYFLPACHFPFSATVGSDERSWMRLTLVTECLVTPLLIAPVTLSTLPTLSRFLGREWLKEGSTQTFLCNSFFFLKKYKKYYFICSSSGYIWFFLSASFGWFEIFSVPPSLSSTQVSRADALVVRSKYLVVLGWDECHGWPLHVLYVCVCVCVYVCVCV